MKMKRILTLYLFTSLLMVSGAVASEISCDPAVLKADLEELHDSDQGSRRGLLPSNDIGNQERLRGMVEECGWPSVDSVGRKAAMGAFLVVQHAPLEMQLEYLPVLRGAENRGDLVPGTLPYLEDRVRVRQGEPQRFGTQFSGRCQLYEISDPERVGQRREAAGLIPLQEYVEHCHERTSDP